MSISLILVGVASIVLTFVHVFGGGRACARPLLDSPLDPVAKFTIYACWHAVTAHLLLGGLTVLWAGLYPTPSHRLLAAVFAVSYLVIAGLFVGVASVSRVPDAWFRLGQWMVFLPMGLAGLWAAYQA